MTHEAQIGTKLFSRSVPKANKFTLLPTVLKDIKFNTEQVKIIDEKCTCILHTVKVLKRFMLECLGLLYDFKGSLGESHLCCWLL